MKKLVLLFFFVCCFISCYHHNTNKQQNLAENQDTVMPFEVASFSISVPAAQKDTLIEISADWAILFRFYCGEMKLWYAPYIVNLNKKDTIKIEGYVYENGSEPDIIVSPNKKYFVLDNIIKGYVEMEDDRILHENYFCAIIDIEKAKMVWRAQSDCSGEWNNEDNWISFDKIVFHSEY